MEWTSQERNLWLRILTTIGVLIICGCGQPEDRVKTLKTATGQAAVADERPTQSCAILTIEVAQQALIEMAERADAPSPIKASLSELQSARATADECYPDVTLLGSWRCIIAERRFVLPYASEEEGVGHFSGIFKLNAKNKWEAVLSRQQALCGTTGSVEVIYDEGEERPTSSESREAMQNGK